MTIERKLLDLANNYAVAELGVEAVFVSNRPGVIEAGRHQGVVDHVGQPTGSSFAHPGGENEHAYQ